MFVRRVDAVVTHPLRLAVLRPGLGADSLVDPEGSVHFAAFLDDDDHPLGAAVLTREPFRPRPSADALRLRGMAVDPDHQRHGVGGLLLAAVVEHAAGAGAELLWCHARDTAIDFYARHGWRTEGDGFAGALDLPHHLMWRPVEPDRPTTSSSMTREDADSDA